MPSAPCTTVTRRSVRARRCRSSKASGSSRTISRNSHTCSCLGVLVWAASMTCSSITARVVASVTRRATRSIIRICSASRSPRRNPSQTGGQPGSDPAGAGEQAAYLVGLIAQHHRQLIGDKFSGPRPTWFAPVSLIGGGGVFGASQVGVAQRRLGEPRLGFRGVAAGIGHRLPSPATVVSVVVVLVVFPRHGFIVTVTSDMFRTYGRKLVVCPPSHSAPYVIERQASRLVQDRFVSQTDDSPCRGSFGARRNRRARRGVTASAVLVVAPSSTRQDRRSPDRAAACRADEDHRGTPCDH